MSSLALYGVSIQVINLNIPFGGPERILDELYQEISAKSADEASIIAIICFISTYKDSISPYIAFTVSDCKLITESAFCDEAGTKAGKVSVASEPVTRAERERREFLARMRD